MSFPTVAQQLQLGTSYDAGQRIARASTWNLMDEKGTVFLVAQDFNFLRTSFTIRQFDENLTQQKEVTIKFSKDLRSINILKSVYFQGNIYLFGYSWVTSKMIKRYKGFYAIKLHATTLDIEKIIPIDENESQDESLSQLADYKVRISPDGSRLICVSSGDEDEKKNQIVTLRAFERGFNPLWEKKIVLPHKNNLFQIRDMLVDKDTNVYLLAWIFAKGRITDYLPFGTDQNFATKIYALKNKATEKHEIPINIGGLVVKDAKLIQKDEQHIACLGFYGRLAEVKNIGVFQCSINTNENKVVQQTKNNLSAEAVKQLHKQRGPVNQKTKTADAGNLFVEYMNVLPNGEMILIGEQQTKETRLSTNSDNKTTSEDVFYYKNLVVARIDATGNFKWTKLIPKLQACSLDEYADFSFFAHADEKNVTIFFNTNKGEEDDKVPYYSAYKKYAQIVQVTLDESGKEEVQTLVEPEKQIVINPKVNCRLKDKTYIVLLRDTRGKDQKIGKLQFD